MPILSWIEHLDKLDDAWVYSVAMNQQRRTALRQYFLAIAQDLVSRGVIKQRLGQSLDQIIQSEMSTIMREISSDLSAIAIEVVGAGSMAIQGAVNRHVDELVARGARALADLVKKGGR